MLCRLPLARCFPVSCATPHVYVPGATVTPARPLSSASSAASSPTPFLHTNVNYINGNWVGLHDHHGHTEVKCPASKALLGTIPNFGAKEAEEAVDAAHAALPKWRGLTGLERGKALRTLGDLMTKNSEDLAQLITLENGKTLAEARGEVAYAASFIHWFAEEAPRLYGDIIPPHRSSARILVTKQPVGVCGVITPWNFPSAMITRKLGAALAAGCTMVMKPSELTPFSALALCDLAAQAGIPAGVVNCVTGDSASIGNVFTENPKVRKISFTGSTRVGKMLAASGAANMKRLSLELGGNAPFIVFEDADVDAAVKGIIASKFRGAGQTCVCANRIYVHDAIYDQVAQKLTDRVSAFRLGDGHDPDVDMGPLINQAAVNSVEELVDDAKQKGAVVACGGAAQPELGGYFYQPTVLRDVPLDSAIHRKEIFGPVAPLYRFTSEQEVVAQANDTPAGLAAYVYTNNYARMFRVSEALEYGMVGLNEPVVSTVVAPFGGFKESGMGREGSKYGIDDYVETKYVCIGGVE